MGCRRESSDFSKVVSNHSNRECDLSSNHVRRDDGAKTGAVKMISKILKTTMHLPDRIQAICWVQFWAWIGRELTPLFHGEQDSHVQAGSLSSSTLRPGSVKSISATIQKPTSRPLKILLGTSAASAPFHSSSFPLSLSLRPFSFPSSLDPQKPPALDRLPRDLRPSWDLSLPWSLHLTKANPTS